MSVLEQQDIQVENVEVALSPFLKELKPLLDNPSKLEVVKDELPEHIDAIRVFAGGTVQLNDGGGKKFWSSPNYTGVDSNNLSTGAVYRVAAGSIVSRVNESCNCVLGCSYFNNSQMSPCEVMTKEFELLGIEDSRILSDPDTFDTIGEVAKLLQFAGRNDWSSVLLVTNFYHKERLMKIVENIDWLVFDSERTDDFNKGLSLLRDGLLKFSVANSEVLIKKFDEGLYSGYISGYMNSEMLGKRLKSENDGVNAINSGEYQRMDPNTNQRVLLKR